MTELEAIPITVADNEDFQRCLTTIGYRICNGNSADILELTSKTFKDRIFSKLDRVWINNHWISTYPNAETLFLAKEVLDHYPGQIEFFDMLIFGNCPFKFFDMWTHDQGFHTIVKRVNNNTISE